MSDSDDHEPGVEWTGRRVVMSPPIKHRTGINFACLLVLCVCDLAAAALIFGAWPICLLFVINAAALALVAYVVRDHDRTWGASPLGTSRKGGRDS